MYHYHFHPMKKTLLLFAALFTAIPLVPPCVAAGSAKPNILFILTDDQGYGDWSITGHPLLKTPNVDRLAAESVRALGIVLPPVALTPA